MIEIALSGLHLDTRRPKKDHTFPVKLRVYYSGKRKYYALGIYLTQHDFDKITLGRRLNEKLRDIKFDLDEYVLNASKVIDELDFFTFELFERKYFHAGKNEKDLTHRFETYIIQLKKEERIGTAWSYVDALKSINSFKSKLSMDEISVNFLKSYEAWMISKGRASTTVGIYMRCLRSILNKAIDEGIISRDIYPFGKNRYIIPHSRNVKKALSMEDIKKIFQYEPMNDGESMAKDFWIFSYLCNGINIMDICRLRYKNIEGDKIIFIRSKTRFTSRNNQKPIVAIINEHIEDILTRRGNKNRDPENYVFPVLSPGVSAEREKALVQQFTKTINKRIGRIGVSCDIEKKVTTYVARHSFSTVLKRSGASIELISESLGHSDLKTTENYLDSFEDSVKKEFYDNLVKF